MLLNVDSLCLHMHKDGLCVCVCVNIIHAVVSVKRKHGALNSLYIERSFFQSDISNGRSTSGAVERSFSRTHSSVYVESVKPIN